MKKIITGYMMLLVILAACSPQTETRKMNIGANQRMGDHPMVWYKHVGQGRIFQTALGHPTELYSDPLFIKHIDGAIVWTAGWKINNKVRTETRSPALTDPKKNP